MTQGIVELENVSHGYGPDLLLSDISLEVPSGAFLFLTGPSGAGKTTFLKLCLGQLAPRAGRVRVFGEDLAGLGAQALAHTRQRIGVVDQQCAFLDHLDVRTNIALPLIVKGHAPDTMAQDLEDLLAWVGLSARADALPPELSGGERQRAALARAVITAPDVIVADEPTGNVDWEMSGRLLRLLTELNRMGKTVLLATHDLALIRAAKTEVQARVLRIAGQGLQLAGADL